MKENCTFKSLDNLNVDKSCWFVKNDDPHQTIEIWAHSTECYTCSPWKLLSIEKGDMLNEIMNSTYSTELYFRIPYDEVDIKRTSYHFSQHGLYGITINSTRISPIEIIKPGNDEYLLLLYTVLLFGFICCTSSITKKVIKCFQRRNSNQDTEPLLNDNIDNIPAVCSFVADNTINSRRENYTSSGERRLNSLDTFRGFSIVLMIFVNYGGGKFYFFQHSPWNGLTVADLVFPWFLWITGVCITLSVKSQLRKDVPKEKICWKILQRSIRLFWIGIILNSIDDNNVHSLRIMGVLQRFSICYLINGVLEVVVMEMDEDSVAVNRWYWKMRDLYKAWISWLLVATLVLIHTLCTFLLHVPHCPSGYLGPGGLHENGKYFNCTGGAARYVDELFLSSRHMYQYTTSKVIYDNPGAFDPEGLFSTLLACVTVTFGVAAGRIILYFPNHRDRILRFLIWTVILGFLGAFLCGWSKETGAIPVNKNLWSLSYVFVTSSFAFCLFAGIYGIIDVLKLWSGRPFSIAGLNSISLYCGHELTKHMLPFAWEPLSNTHFSHFIMNLAATSWWIAIAFWMHARKLYFVV